MSDSTSLVSCSMRSSAAAALRRLLGVGHERLQELAKAAQPLLGRGIAASARTSTSVQRLEEAHRPALPPRPEPVLGGVTDGAGRSVDDAQEVGVGLGVDHEPQVRGRRPSLPPARRSCARSPACRGRAPGAGPPPAPGSGRSPGRRRPLVGELKCPPGARAWMPGDSSCASSRSSRLMTSAQAAPLVALGPQPLRHPVGVLGNDRVGSVEDVLVAAVVLLELDDGRAGVVLWEIGGCCPPRRPASGRWTGRRRPPPPGWRTAAEPAAAAARICTGLVSWNSSTSTCWKRRGYAARVSSFLRKSSHQEEQQVAEVHRVGRPQEASGRPGRHAGPPDRGSRQGPRCPPPAGARRSSPRQCGAARRGG